MTTYPDFSVNTHTGHSGITRFEFQSYVSPLSGNVVWYFGDGSTSTEANPAHIYQSPGIYPVSLYIYEPNSSPIPQQQSVEVKLVLNKSIYFDFAPPPTFAGHYNRYPFRVHITSPDTDDHYITLGCQHSRSDAPQDIPNKWSFLRPQWRFFDVKGNPVQKIKTIDTIVKTNSAGILDPLGTYVAGVTGYADFYFTDDIFNFDLASVNLPYSTIIASLDTLDSPDYTVQADTEKRIPSFANSLATAVCPHIFLWRTPDYLKITENGINAHINTRWSSSNVPIVVNCNFHSEFPDPFKDGNGVKVLNSDTFFVHNFPLNNTESLRLDLQIPGDSASFTPEPSLEWTDSSNYKTPGYYKGSFNLSHSAIEGVQINAALTFGIPVLRDNHYNPLLWFFTPKLNKLHIAQDLSFPALSDISKNIIPCIRSISLSDLLSTESCVVAAGHMPDYQAWVLDPKFQKLTKISSFGTQLTSVDIPDLLLQTQVTSPSGADIIPHTIVEDGSKNVWISVLNCASAFKIDCYGNLLSATQTFALNNSSIHASPLCMETDLINNLYVSYSQGTSGSVIRYNPDGTILDTIESLYSNKKPTQILCDNTNHIWLSVLTDPINNVYDIEKRSFEWNLIEYLSYDNYPTPPTTRTTIFGPYTGVNHMCLDENQNLWISHAKNYLTKISNYSYHCFTTSLTSSQSGFISEEYGDIKAVGSNSSGNVYALNSKEGIMYVVNSYSGRLEKTFSIKTSSSTAGDWTGFNWINKYAARLPEFSLTEEYQTIYGNSAILDFYPDTSSRHGLFKVNENYDLAQNIKNYAFTPKLAESTNFFDNFMGAVFGTSPLQPDDLGVEIYEKISNFVSNHKDIDLCSVGQLYDAAAVTDLETDDFRLRYPPSIQRLMDLASINLSRLRGHQIVGELNFNSRDQNGFYNKGVPVSSLGYEVSGGTFLVLGDKTTYNPYRLIYTGRIDDSLFYDLDTLAQYIGLPKDWRNVYDFYTYVPSITGKFVDSVIDWNNPQTTLSFYNSSVDAWFGQEGVLETVFSYELYKGLNLLND
jgi:PKD repeat protein